MITPLTPKEIGLNKYQFKLREYSDVVRYIYAANKKSAWGKFCRQYFGALKPDRTDWTVTKVAE